MELPSSNGFLVIFVFFVVEKQSSEE